MEEMKTLTIGGKTYKVVDEDAVRSYYSTTREDLSVTLGKEGAVPSDVTTNVVWGLYDALVAKYPDRVQKNEITVHVRGEDGNPTYDKDGNPIIFTNYEYVISTGEYNTKGIFYDRTGIDGMDTHIKKPKYLILSGAHPNERPPIIITYRFIRDVVEGHNIPDKFREGCVIHVLPIGNPWGLDELDENGIPSMLTEGQVDIERNFNWNHGENVDEDKRPPGNYPESEKETQAIARWLDANQDAEAFFDIHIQGSAVNEILQVIGISNTEICDTAKKIVMRGVERVIPFWRDIIDYPEGTIYYSSIYIGEGGVSIGYAAEKLGIPSLCIEVSARQKSTQDEFAADKLAITNETVAAGAEAIGNALIEFYEQYFMSEVVDMTETNAKLDELLKRTSFRIETGVYTVKDSLSGTQQIKVPCTSGAKMLNFFPDEDTLNSILQYSNKTADEGGSNCFVSFSGQTVEKFSIRTLAPAYRGYQLMVKQLLTSNGPEAKFHANDHASVCDNADGFTFTAVNLKNGNYNWTAYYWND